MSARIEQAFQFASQLNCQCPKCHTPLFRIENSLKCADGHTYNVNRKGYFNFLSKPTSEVYDARLFEARSRIYSAGFYDAVSQHIISHIQEGSSILDCGTGNGYYLHEILEARKNVLCAGIDMSKDAISYASVHPALWCVADLRDLPFPDHQFDLILSILSPSDYQTFRRLLKPSGEVIKVIPGEDYLKEIRSRCGLSQKAENNSVELLQKQMNIQDHSRFQKSFPISSDHFSDFVHMTPMTAALSESEKQRICDQPSSEITIDLHIYTATF